METFSDRWRELFPLRCDEFTDSIIQRITEELLEDMQEVEIWIRFQPSCWKGYTLSCSNTKIIFNNMPIWYHSFCNKTPHKFSAENIRISCWVCSEYYLKFLWLLYLKSAWNWNIFQADFSNCWTKNGKNFSCISVFFSAI